MGKLLRTAPRVYQVKGSSFLLSVKTGALFMQQRTGKTLTMFLALARLWLRGYRRVVVVCPKSAIGVWKRQAHLHLKIPYEMMSPLEEDKWEWDGSPRNHLVFIVINFENTWRPRWQRIIQDFSPQIFIVDESHRIKSQNSRQSKACWELSRNCEYRWAATGTPTDGDDIDLWAQFRFIQGQLLGSDWRTYERLWLRKSGFGFFARKLKKHLQKKHSAILAPYTFSITRKEALKLPPEEDYVIPFQLTGEAVRAYHEIENNLMVEIGDEVIVTPMAMQKMIKLQQITGGFLHTEKSIIRMEQDKLGILADFLEDYKKTKVVIFARFTEEVKAIEWMMKKMKRTVGVLDGRTKDRTIWEEFQDKRHPETLAIQCQTGGESIEVSVADVGIFYSRLFSFLNYDQCRARLLGRRKKVMFVHLAAENTIDEDLMTVIERKGRKAKDILTALKSRRRT